MLVKQDCRTATVLACSDDVLVGIFASMDDAFTYLEYHGEITWCVLRDASGVYDIEVSMRSGVHKFWAKTMSEWTARLYKFLTPAHLN